MSSRPVTRARNADTHPGLRVQGEKRKRRTTAEVEEAKKEAAAEKLARQEKKEQGLKKVAEIEEKLADEDNNVTPRPTRRPLRLRRASTPSIPLYGSDRSESEMEGPAKSDTTRQDQGSYAPSDHSGDLNADTDTDMGIEKQPTAKKQKTSQSKASDAGGPAHREGTRPRGGDEVRVQVATPRTADKGAQGKTRAAKFVYVIDAIMLARTHDVFTLQKLQAWC